MNGTLLFDPEIGDDFSDYDSAGLDRLSEAEERHFWFRTRRAVILQLFQKYVDESERIIEIGAGTGSVSRMLIDHGYRVAVGDVFLKGLEYARRYGIGERYQFDLMRAPFRDHFDVIGMFDVLEHLADESLALENVRKMLMRNGRVIVTVPAHKWLWSRSDEVARHKRRYDLKGIVELFEASGFEVLEARSHFVLMLPFLMLRALVNPARGNEVRTGSSLKELSVVPVVNEVLVGIMTLENVLLRRISSRVGGSIALVGMKL